MSLFIFRVKKFFKSIPGLFKRTQIKAVYDDDLKSLIDSLGISPDIESGNFKCKYCSAVITFENLQAISKESGEIKIVCSNLECVSKLAN